MLLAFWNRITVGHRKSEEEFSTRLRESLAIQAR